MVKLASARESRMYGPRLARNRSEYMNAGLYVFATILLLTGFSLHLSNQSKSGLLVLLVALSFIIVVNTHDLVAHLAAIDYRFPLMGLDFQLMLVEFAVPLLQALGTLLSFLGFLFLFIQEQKVRGYEHLEKHALNMLIAGPALWLLGSIHNACQIYERADGHVQVLQQCVHTPFLMGSLLFMIGAILDRREHGRSTGVPLLGWNWIWFGIFGSLLLFIGGITNVVKVFKMQQIDGVRLEKLRGGAQERLVCEREGQVPLIIEEQRRRKRQAEEGSSKAAEATPYKDVLVGQA
ncbi:hypothetical protein LguiA_024166 [Lonicera macranthoides]